MSIQDTDRTERGWKVAERLNMVEFSLGILSFITPLKR